MNSPILTLPKSSNKKTHTRTNTELPSIIPSYSNDYLPIQRLLQQYPSALYCGRLTKTDSATGTIGPGYYNCSPSTLGGPSFVFPSARRFPCAFSALSSPLLRETPDFTQRNKNLKPFVPEIRLELVRQKAASEDFKIRQTISKKKQISSLAKKSKLEKLKERNYRLQMKVQHVEVQAVKTCWAVMLISMAISNSALYLVRYRKELHRRAMKMLNFALRVSLVFGRFKRKLGKIKTRKALGVLATLAVRVRYWVRLRKVKYVKILDERIVHAAAHDKIFRLMYQWKVSLVYIQRKMKKLIVQKKIWLALKLLQWDKIERNMIEMKQGVKNSGKGKIQSMIPISIKENIIRKHLKARVRQYCFECREYRERLKELMNEYSAKEHKANINCKRATIAMIPDRPKPEYRFSKKDYTTMIKIAMNVRRKSQILVKMPSRIKM